jgi:hypothetical protein
MKELIFKGRNVQSWGMETKRYCWKTITYCPESNMVNILLASGEILLLYNPFESDSCFLKDGNDIYALDFLRVEHPRQGYHNV